MDIYHILLAIALIASIIIGVLIVAKRDQRLDESREAIWGCNEAASFAGTIAEAQLDDSNLFHPKIWYFLFNAAESDSDAWRQWDQNRRFNLSTPRPTLTLNRYENCVYAVIASPQKLQNCSAAIAKLANNEPLTIKNSLIQIQLAEIGKIEDPEAFLSAAQKLTKDVASLETCISRWIWNAEGSDLQTTVDELFKDDQSIAAVSAP